MQTLFLAILKMSVSASLAAVVVLFARLCLRKTPTVFSYVLWGVVLFRMLCPGFIQMEIPVGWLQNLDVQEETFDQQYIQQTSPNSYQAVDSSINVPLTNSNTSDEAPVAEDIGASTSVQTENTSKVSSVLSKSTIISISSVIWIAGVAGLLGYAMWSGTALKKKIGTAFKVCDNVYHSERINTAFVLGLFNPKIYIPSAIARDQHDAVILHEQTHIRRGDNIIKMVAYIAICIHWFNPFLWLCYSIMCHDMEKSCDEATITELCRKGYSVQEAKSSYGEMLFAMAVKKNRFIPVSFAGNYIKERINSIMKFRKLKSSTTILVLIFCLLIITLGMIACKPNKMQNANGTNEYISETDIMDQFNTVTEFETIYEFSHQNAHEIIEYYNSVVDNNRIYDYVYEHMDEVENGIIIFEDEVIYCGISENHWMTELTIPDNTTVIFYAEHFINFSELIIPNSVRYIYPGAFSGDWGISEIQFGSGIKSIPHNTFENCTNLIEVTIPEGIECIEDEAFFNCSCLTKITIPDSVIFIGQTAFANTYHGLTICCSYGSYAHQYALYYGYNYEII